MLQRGEEVIGHDLGGESRRVDGQLVSTLEDLERGEVAQQVTRVLEAKERLGVDQESVAAEG